MGEQAPETIDADRRRPLLPLLVGSALLVAFALQAGFAARRDSVTIDEFLHLPVGLYYASQGDFSLDPMNPPGRTLFAAPLSGIAPSLAPGAQTRPWVLAGDFMRRNAGGYHGLYLRARGVAIALACALGGLVAAWATALYGSGAGLAALLLFAFSPSMLAHGHLVTLDLPGALGFSGSLFAFWGFLARPGLARAAAVGACSGIAVLLKLSCLLLAPSLAVCGAIHLVRAGRGADSPARWVAYLFAAALPGLLVLNLGYGFEGTLRPLGETAFLADGRLAALQQVAPWLRVPLPLPLLSGVDHVMHLAAARTAWFYLLGELSNATWWYYHLVAFAVKTPLPIAILSLLALSRWLLGRSAGRHEHVLFVPVLLVFVSNALLNAENFGARHLLPAYPLLFVGAAPLLSGPLARVGSELRARRVRLPTCAALIGVAWLVAGTVSVAPRYLQYFNELAGGPEGGHRVLVDSNLDWGQDLIRLREYMDERRIERVQLAYFGRVDPRLYGVAFDPLERGRSRGVAAVSASFLMGRPYFWYRGGRKTLLPPDSYAWLRDRTPADRVGAMFIYELP